MSGITEQSREPHARPPLPPPPALATSLVYTQAALQSQTALSVLVSSPF